MRVRVLVLVLVLPMGLPLLQLQPPPRVVMKTTNPGWRWRFLALRRWRGWRRRLRRRG